MLSYESELGALVRSLRSAGILYNVSHFSSNLGGHVFYAGCENSHIVDMWREIRSLVDRTSYWPIIYAPSLYGSCEARPTLPNQEELDELTNIALTIDPIDYLSSTAWGEPYPDDHWIAAKLEEGREFAEEDGFDPEEFWTDLPKWARRLEDLDGQGLLFVPASQGWQVPIALDLPSRTGNPNCAQHAALFKRWSDIYDVQVVVFSKYVAILAPSSTNMSREDALRLAWEHQIYCSDKGLTDACLYAGTLFQGAVWDFEWE